MSEESTNAADVRVGEPVVRIEGLRKSFGDNVVLRGIDLEVQRGEVVVILGPSGSGKSTLLRCVNLLETPTDGRIFFEDTEITAKKTDINKVRAKVGMVFQNFNLFPHLTAKKNVMLAQQKVLHRGKEEAEKIAVEQLTRVAWPTVWTTSPPNCRAASSSAWPSPARLPWTRTSCCSTRPPARWTPNSCATCWAS